MNKVILIGNLTRDPELSETNSGIAVCRFGLAVNRQYSSADGERETDFFQVTAWRGTGENVARYCKKGHKVAVVGSIQMRNYEDREVEKPRRFIWECACGGGHLSERLTERGYDVFNSDIKNRGYAKQHLVLDFLKQEDKLFSFEHDILTNPPYKYATEFVLKALELLPEGCKCYMFLKLTFLEGKRRYIELFRDTPPAAFTSFPSAFYAPKTQSLTVCGRAAAPPSRMRGLCGKRATRGQQRCGGYRRTA